MKILFVQDDLQGGGKQRRLVQLIRGLHQSTDLELHLVLFDHPTSASRTGRTTVKDVKELVDFPEVWNYNVKIHFLERKSRHDLSIFPRFRKLLSSIKPDIINVWSVMGSFYTIPLLGLGAPPLITSFVADCNGPAFPSPWWFLTRLAYLRSNTVTGNSRAGLEAYRVPKRKARTIYNGFDFDRFRGVVSRAEMRKQLGINTEFAVAMTARFDQYKDHRTFLTGFEIVARKRNDITAVCIGQGQAFEATRSLVPDWLRDRVVFTGFRKDVEAILSACDCSVLCTNAALHGEGISNSILEGMAAGHPVIATNAGGSPEIVIHGETGFLVPPSDPDAVAQGLSKWLESPEEMRAMGVRARAWIHKQFSLDGMTAEFLDTFHKAVSK